MGIHFGIVHYDSELIHQLEPDMYVEADTLEEVVGALVMAHQAHDPTAHAGATGQVVYCRECGMFGVALDRFNRHIAAYNAAQTATGDRHDAPID